MLPPDGRTVAFSIKRKQDPQSDIALLDLATGKVRVLTAEAESGRRWQAVAWTVDGRTLVASGSSFI